MEQLPPLSDDLWLNVFANLDVQSLGNSSVVCKSWNALAATDGLWKKLYEENWSMSEDMREARTGCNVCGNPARKLYDLGQQRPSVPGPTAAQRNSGRPPKGWKEGYRARKEVDSNWAAGNCQEMHLYAHGDFIRNAQLNDGMLVTASGSYARKDCTMRVWDVDRGRCQHRLVGHQGPIWSCCSDGQRYVASCSEDSTVCVWDLRLCRTAILKGHTGDVHCLGFDPVGGQIVSGGRDQSCHLWSLEAVAQALEDADHDAETVAVPEADVASGDSTGLAVGGVHQQQRWASFDLTARVPSQRIMHYRQEARCIQVEADICCFGDGERHGSSVHVYSTAGNRWQSRSTLTGPRLGVNSLVFDPRLQRCVAGDGCGKAHVWDLERCEPLFVIQCHGSWDEAVNCLQYSPRRLASASTRSVALSDLVSQRVVKTFQVPDMPLALQVDDTKAVCGCHDGRVYVWDLRTDRLLHTLTGHAERVWAVAFDDWHLVSAGLDGQVIVRSFLPEDMRFQGLNWGSEAAGDSGEGGGGR